MEDILEIVYNYFRSNIMIKEVYIMGDDDYAALTQKKYMNCQLEVGETFINEYTTELNIQVTISDILSEELIGLTNKNEYLQQLYKSTTYIMKQFIRYMNNTMNYVTNSPSIQRFHDDDNDRTYGVTASITILEGGITC